MLFAMAQMKSLSNQIKNADDITYIKTIELIVLRKNVMFFCCCFFLISLFQVDTDGLLKSLLQKVELCRSVICASICLKPNRLTCLTYHAIFSDYEMTMHC